MKNEYKDYLNFMATKILNEPSPVTNMKLRKVMETQVDKLKELYLILSLSAKSEGKEGKAIFFENLSRWTELIKMK